MGAFEEHVLAWLQQHRPTATEVVKVDSYGTDWMGDTEGGFYSGFSVDITWLDLVGGRHSFGVEGEAMDSLWEHVVGGFTQLAPQRQLRPPLPYGM